MHRIDVSFLSQHQRIAAWLYLPGDPSAVGHVAPVACVVLAHGFGATRAARLWAFAERFAAAGYAALAFDYRHFGDSEGEPRQLLDIARQLEDWRAAIAFVRTRREVRPEQVVAWGSSYGGGHVAIIAGEDNQLAAAITQNPFMDGVDTVLGLGPVNVARLTIAGLRDELRRLRGRRPFTIPIVGPPGTTAAMTTPDSLPGYGAMFAPGEGWRNEVAARAALRVGLYRPGRRAARITCPWLVQVSDHDVVTRPRPTLAAAARAPRSEVVRYRGGHFDIYQGDGFERAVTDQLAFLARVLPTPA